jgi:hypothetical protein
MTSLVGLLGAVAAGVVCANGTFAQNATSADQTTIISRTSTVRASTM